MKKLFQTRRNGVPHWVGDGFPVRTVFSYHDDPRGFSPFLMLDYGGPTTFAPSPGHRRGVGEHPHRGFETVTIVYAGEVEHADSHGGGGLIGPGDVQWMTAGAGLVHSEFHGTEYAKRGGPFEMIQLWVNLPKKDKMAKPGYQAITSAQIPTVGPARVIAGELDGVKGPASTFTPINLWDVRLAAGETANLPVPATHATQVFVLTGEISTSGEVLTDATIGTFATDAEPLVLTARKESKLLVLTGEPINEPVIGYGPFVMNTPDEIRQAIEDFQSGKMGRL